jgi:hypothetical protein
MKRKLTKQSKKIDVHPLSERENPLNARKGMLRTNNLHTWRDGIQIESPIIDLVRQKFL